MESLHFGILLIALLKDVTMVFLPLVDSKGMLKIKINVELSEHKTIGWLCDASQWLLYHFQYRFYMYIDYPEYNIYTRTTRRHHFVRETFMNAGGNDQKVSASARLPISNTFNSLNMTTSSHCYEDVFCSYKNVFSIVSPRTTAEMELLFLLFFILVLTHAAIVLI